MTNAERLTRLETLVDQIFESHKETNRRIEDTNEKLDDLIALRNRGVGAFWLASALLGTAIVGVINLLIDWMRG